ncbi:hypothetical protein AG0111_0g8366 [Alternaria gaisen]|uniref:Uncharacterized protein n=1 Tax=Alternaria gaisen TaxID=167740 RepID=A0ACB6FFX0_9PLEO|nr:hypothetical protein AG0111_0g8366 [Alternaria gaisen]
MAGAYPYGVQLASSGMNISTLPAASIWADTCAIDARQFRGLANQTLPFQIDDPLADVLHDVGLGSSNGSQTVVDIKAFMKSLGDRPFYSRSMLRHAADQLSRARNGLKITLTDCYGAKRVYPARDLSLPSQDFSLGYNGLHLLATAQSAPQGDHFSLDDMLPIYVRVGKKAKETTNLYDRVLQKVRMQNFERLWQWTPPRHILFDSLNRLKHTARVTNIVCIRLGTLQKSDPRRANPTMQHIVASSIAQDLERIYEAEGTPVDTPITIIAQDPAYDELDRRALLDLPVPIKIVSDPEGFLAINESSLVFSSYPAVPVKQLVADFSSEAPDGKGPAALFVNRNLLEKAHGDVNLIRYDWDIERPYTDPHTSDYLRMPESYTQVFDGERLFGEGFRLTMPTSNGRDYVPGYE